MHDHYSYGFAAFWYVFAVIMFVVVVFMILFAVTDSASCKNGKDSYDYGTSRSSGDCEDSTDGYSFLGRGNKRNGDGYALGGAFLGLGILAVLLAIATGAGYGWNHYTHMHGMHGSMA